MSRKKTIPPNPLGTICSRVTDSLRSFRALKSKIDARTAGLVCCGLITSSASADLIVSNQAQAELTVNRIKASHFLSQATFGPSWDEITELAEEIERRGETRAFNDWINDQFGLGPTLMDAEMVRLVEQTGRPLRSDLDVDTPSFQGPRVYRDYVVWDRKLTAPDQLRQRMSDALSQILVVGDENVLRNRIGWRGTSTYNDILLNNAFGNYRTLLSEIIYDPAMGLWLDAAGNERESVVGGIPRFPDENFAREFLQLFTVGVFELNEGGQILNLSGNPLNGPRDTPAELYTNETIQEFARVFTGLNYTRRGPSDTSSFRNRFFNFESPMIMHNNFHSPGRKTLLNGTRTPGGAPNGDRDIRMAIDNAFNHDNCPPFVCRLLIQRFTTSNPSTDYVQAVVNAFKGVGLSSNRGSLRAVIREILMNPEARDSLDIRIRNISGGRRRITVNTRDNLHGKLKEPFMQITALLRAFNIRSTDPNVSGTFRFNNLTDTIGQFPLDANSVFNFYLPDHQPVGRIQRANIVAPEFEITTPSRLHNLINLVRTTMQTTGSRANRRNLGITGRNVAGRAEINIQPILTRINDANSLINYLNIVFCHGTMHDDAVDTYRDEILNRPISDEQKATSIITTILSSPDFAVHN